MTAEQRGFRVCALCGHTGGDVEPGLVAWREPVEGKTYDWLDRCRDRHLCRNRVELVGDAWPVDDGTIVRPSRPVTVVDEEPAWLS